MEHKASPLIVESIEDRVVKQVFAVLGNVDDGNDRILPKAFKRTINQMGNRIRVLWQHDASEPPIGKALLLKELGKDDLPPELKAAYPDAAGALYGEVEYLATPRAEEVLAGIKAGAITENSIGYDALKFSFEPAADGKGQIRNLQEVRLWDISPVNWGMNAATLNMKHHLSPVAVRALAEMEAWLERAAAEEQVSGQRLARMQGTIDELKALLTLDPPGADPALTVTALMQRIRIYAAEAEGFGL